MKHSLEVFAPECDITIIDYNGKPADLEAMDFFKKQVDHLKPFVKRCLEIA